MISFEMITAWDQAMSLRRLRNECRHWMTGDQSEITVEAQHEFFERQLLPGHTRAWLLREGPAAAAYATLKPGADGCVWMSTGVAGWARGRGLGTLAVGFVTLAGHHLTRKPVRLAVFQDNHAARHIYLKAGYTVTGIGLREPRVIEYMEHR